MSQVKIPNNYRCPLSTKIMLDPVFATDGFTYEREEIEKWFKDKDTSPKTNVAVASKIVVPNNDKKTDIQEFLSEHPELYEAGEVYLSGNTIANLAKAIKANNVDDVKQMLQIDARLLTVNLDDNGYTAFHLAAQYAPLEMLRLVLDLLQLKTKVDAVIKAPKPSNWNPVTLDQEYIAAVKRNDLNAVALLIKLGANINVQATPQDKPSVYIAAENNWVELAKTLLINGASADIVCSPQVENDVSFMGPTALCVATAMGYKEMAKLLIDYHANTRATKGYKAPLFYAVMFNKASMVQLLLDYKANPEEKDDHGDTPIHLAAKMGRDAIMKIFLDKQCSLSVTDNIGRAPLHLVLISGHKDLAKLLIERGADTNAKDKQGLTSMHYCVQWNHPDIVTLLLSNNSNINLGDAQNATPLHYAVKFARVNLLAILLASNANVHSTDNDGRTPLHYISAMDIKSKDGPEIVSLLLEGGADHNTKDANGKTASELAREKGRNVLGDLIIQKYKENKKKRFQQLNDIPILKDQIKALATTVEQQSTIIKQQNTTIDALKKLVQSMYLEMQQVKQLYATTTKK